MSTQPNPLRGDIWDIRFDPSEGDEIQKIRPAVVMNHSATGRASLRIVVPITGLQAHFSAYFWMVQLQPSPKNGLTKESAANCSQVKSVSVNRFLQKRGQLTVDEIEETAAAIALSVDFKC